MQKHAAWLLLIWTSGTHRLAWGVVGSILCRSMPCGRHTAAVPHWPGSSPCKSTHVLASAHKCWICSPGLPGTAFTGRNCTHSYSWIHTASPPVAGVRTPPQHGYAVCTQPRRKGNGQQVATGRDTVHQMHATFCTLPCDNVQIDLQTGEHGLQYVTPSQNSVVCLGPSITTNGACAVRRGTGGSSIIPAGSSRGSHSYGLQQQ
jgi:hypothetical protein